MTENKLRIVPQVPLPARMNCPQPVLPLRRAMSGNSLSGIRGVRRRRLYFSGLTLAAPSEKIPVLSNEGGLFKSIIKLDRNFHVYVHGNKSKIENGRDIKGKYVKLYYDESR